MFFNYTLTLRFLVQMWNLCNLVNFKFLKNKKSYRIYIWWLLHMSCMWHAYLYNCDYLPHAHFVFIELIFSWTQSLRSNFAVYLFFSVLTSKSPGITQTSIVEENSLINKKSPPSFAKFKVQYFLYSYWKFQVFKIAKFEFQVTVHCGRWIKCYQLWALNVLKIEVSWLHGWYKCVICRQYNLN